MKATNQQMTSEQLDELMVVAVSMQRDAEKLDERPVAVFAYAIQLVLAELQNTRQQLAAVVAEAAGLKQAIDATIGWQESTDAENVESIIMLLNIKTPATDAAIANIQVQGVEMFAHSMAQHLLVMEKNGEDAITKIQVGTASRLALAFAAQLRQGAA